MNSKIIFDDFEKALKNFEVALSIRAVTQIGPSLWPTSERTTGR